MTQRKTKHNDPARAVLHDKILTAFGCRTLVEVADKLECSYQALIAVIQPSRQPRPPRKSEAQRLRDAISIAIGHAL